MFGLLELFLQPVNLFIFFSDYFVKCLLFLLLTVFLLCKAAKELDLFLDVKEFVLNALVGV